MQIHTGLQDSLFKKVLLSFFPKEAITNGINPAGMFVSFISAKQFFSLVTRKIVENYKINLFDVALDPFEVKIGFGEKPAIKVKDIELYYAYCATANLNGYKFFNPSNLANGVTILTSVYTHESFSPGEEIYFSHFLITVYLLTFVFVARVKVFPSGDKETNFNWFIEVFFSFYQVVFEKTKKNLSAKKLLEIEKRLLKNPEVFFFLYFFFKQMNDVLYVDFLAPKESYTRLFYDELKKGPLQEVAKHYVENVLLYIHQTSFSPTEKNIIDLLLPVDLLIRYVFNADDVALSSKTIFTEIFKNDTTDAYLTSFLQDGSKLEDFLIYILTQQTVQENFFVGMQKFIMHRFRTDISSYDVVQEKEMNDFVSSIGNEDIPSSGSSVSIPEKLKQESFAIERFLNFYVTFVGGLSVSRGDSFFCRVFRKNILQSLVTEENLIGDKTQSLHYYGSLLYVYSKNMFYYKYAYDNIRAGKDKFNLPFRATLKEVYSNMFIISLFNENFITTVLQDINPSDVKIYIKNKKILETFHTRFSERISTSIHMERDAFISKVYTNVDALLRKKTLFLPTLLTSLTQTDIHTIKGRLYTFDFWLFQEVCEHLSVIKSQLWATYGDMTILGIMGAMRDTLLGLLLYATYLKTKSENDKKDPRLDDLFTIYCSDIITVAEDHIQYFLPIIFSLFSCHQNILAQRSYLDDNEIFFKFGYENWVIFTKEKSTDDVTSDIMGEDIVWFRGFLKNITYYNRRYILPV